MKQLVGGALLGALLVGTVWFVAGSADHNGASSDERAAGSAENAKQDGLPRAGVVVMDAAARKRAGIGLVRLASAEGAPERKAFGRVVDPTPLAEAVASVAAAQSASSTAAAEAKRLRALHLDDRNVSQRSLEAAESDAAVKTAAEAAARARLLGAWGSEIGERTDLAAFIDALLAGSYRLVRLNLPAGENVAAKPAQARIQSLATRHTDSDAAGMTTSGVIASLVGAAATVDSGTQGRGFYFLVDHPTADLVPGQAVTGYFATGEPPVVGVLVPFAAVIRSGGEAWIWLEDGDSLVRTRVALAMPQATGWLVGDRGLVDRNVVSAGAQQMLSAELHDQLGDEED